MSAEQVLRVAIVKQTEGFSYEDLAFHILDLRRYRTLCRIGVTEKGIGKSALASAIKNIGPATWEAIIAFLDSESYEDAVRNAVSLGGDSDTLACITGGIAEAFYGALPEEIREWVQEHLTPDLWKVTEVFCQKYR